MPARQNEDDMEAFLKTIEYTVNQEGWSKHDWVNVLAQLLNRKAQLAYYAMDAGEARDYELVKAEILTSCGRSPVNAAGDFHKWLFKTKVNPNAQNDDLLHIDHLWLQSNQLTGQEVR